MFGVSGQEIFFIVLFAVILLGPDKLPQVARAVARGYREFVKVRRHVDSTVSDLRSELKLDDVDLNLDLPELKAPQGRRVPLDQLHAAEEYDLKPAQREPLEISPEDDYLAG